MSSLRRLFILSLYASLLFSSCSITRRVPPGRHLLVDNEVRIDNDRIDKDELKAIIKQKPNRKILFIWRFHLRTYNMAANGRQGKFWKYLRNTVGEQPVLLDSFQTDRSVQQLQLYLQKKGYFDAVVWDTTTIAGINADGSGRDRKKARVKYFITTGSPYRYRNITYDLPDPGISQLFYMDSSATLIKPGHIYDEDVMTAERERITNMMRNEGYYFFNRDYLTFSVDSTLPGRDVDVNMKLALPKNAENNSVLHKKYYLSNIYVVTDYHPGREQKYSDTVEYAGLSFLTNEALNIKPGVIVQHSFLRRGELFQQRNHNETYRKLTDLRIYQSVNISYRPSDTLSGTNQLDAFILLSPMARQNMDFEAEGTNRSGNLGIGGSIFYTNRNTFRGGELVELRMKGGLEALRYDTSAVSTEEEKLFLFNTAEFGPELSVTFPRFPFVHPEKISRYFTPKTTLLGGYQYHSRPEFSRRIINFRFGFNWREFTQKAHHINVVDINFVKINPKNDFEQFLERIDNPFIERTYTNHLTAGGNYTFTLNSRKPRNATSGHFFFFRGGLDIGGHSLWLFNNLANSEKVDGSYQVFGVPFAQFTKIDADLRYYRILHEKHNLAFRIASGAGIPYGNMDVLPLEKSYFSGGANSIRAWGSRTLGPGSFDPGASSANTLRIGDMMAEANVEYRFDLIKIVEGAIFLDAGNIWLLQEDKDRPGGQFALNNFYRQLALGSGLGVRFDFTYFIFRIDWGVKVLDPMRVDEDRFVITKILDSDWKQDYRDTHGGVNSYRFTHWNFGIGYPF